MKYREEALPARFADKAASINVRIWEPDGYDQTLFCLQGFVGNGGDFLEIARSLEHDRIRIVAPDLIGRGKSTYFGDRRYYTLRSYLHCIGTVRKAFVGNEFSVLATSAGGVYGLYLFLVEKISPKKIILNDVPVVIDERVVEANRRLSHEIRQTFQTEEQAVAWFRATRPEISFGSKEKLTAFARNRFVKTGQGYRYSVDPVLAEAESDAAGRRYELISLLSAPDSDILLMYGAESNYIDHNIAADVEARLPNLSLRTDFESGHPLSLTCPSEIEAVRQFLLTP